MPQTPAANIQRPKFRTITIRALVDRYDPGARYYQPTVYFFSGGRTKKEPRVPGIYK